MLYVLDEPSIGLHQRDNERLLGTLRRLRDLGNTVLVVEHDEDAIRAADHLIDMGPAAGVDGGHVVAEGTPAEVAANPQVADRRLPVRAGGGSRCRRCAGRCRRTAFVQVVGARGNNLKNDHRRISAGHVHLRHRRVRRRQIHAGDRHAVQGRGAPADGRRRGAGAA